MLGRLRIDTEYLQALYLSDIATEPLSLRIREQRGSREICYSLHIINIFNSRAFSFITTLEGF